MRVVLDSNVIVAAFATRGLCQAVLEYCLSSHEVVLSDPILDEVCRNLRKKLKVPVATTTEIERFLRSHATLVTPAPVDAKVCRDKDDLLVLRTALGAGAPYLVTGDDDLLEIKQYGGFRILSPREFWEEARKARR